MEDSFPGSLCAEAEPLDTDGLVSHNDHLQRRMVQIFSSHQAEVNALRRDLAVSRIALSQAGIKPETLLTSGEEAPLDQMLDGRSGVESTASEVSTRPSQYICVSMGIPLFSYSHLFR